MQAQQPHLECRVDERAHTRGELALVGQEREQHAGRELRLEHEIRPGVDHEHVLETEDEPVRRAQQKLQTLSTQPGVDLLDQHREPGGAPLVAAAKRFDRPQAADGLDEVTLLLGRDGDLLVPGVT
jgi:hypothetical protein